MSNHMAECRINTVAYSYKNLIVASGADDGKIVLSDLQGQKIQAFSSDRAKIVPINSVQFSHTNEFFAGGLADGFVKLWDLKKKDVVRTYKASTHFMKNSITSIQFNLTNEILGASTNKGQIHLFPVGEVIKNSNSYSPSTATVSEVVNLKASDSTINQMKFSPFTENTLVSAQDDGLLSLFDVGQKKLVHQFKYHSASVKGVAFSPMNKLLMCSISLDKQLVFYDVQQKTKVQAIKTELPLNSLSFNTDGHTVAAGTANSGIVVVYDLRNQGQPLAILEGHKGTVNALSFKNLDPPRQSASSSKTITITNASQQIVSNEESKRNPDSQSSQQVNVSNGVGTQFKTMEQIREEARKNVDLKKKQREMQKQQQMQQNQQNQVTDLQNQSKSPTLQTLSNNTQPKNSIRQQLDRILIEDIAMKDDFSKRPQNLNINNLNQHFDNNSPLLNDQQQRALSEEYKEEVQKFIIKKMQEVQAQSHQMLNNFHIEIIRQFEFQRNQIDSIIAEYLIDENDLSDGDDDYALDENKVIEYLVERGDDDDDDVENADDFDELYLH